MKKTTDHNIIFYNLPNLIEICVNGELLHIHISTTLYQFLVFHFFARTDMGVDPQKVEGTNTLLHFLFSPPHP